MPTWSEARRAGQTASLRQLKERASLRADVNIGRYDFDNPKCLYCPSTGKLRTGWLPVTGAIWFCPNCRDKYLEDKAWEATL